MIIEVCILVLMLAFVKWVSDNRPSGNIPGYMGLPLLGVSPWLSTENPTVTLTSWSKKLGDIYSVKIGHKRWITLNSHKAIKDIFLKNGHHTFGRPEIGIMTNAIGREGLLFTHDNRSMKNFLSPFIRNRMTLMEPHINEECRFLVEELRSHVGKQVDIKRILLKTTCNIALKLTTGCRKDYRDVWMEKYVDDFVNLLNHPKDAFFVAIMLLVYKLKMFPPFNRVSKNCEGFQLGLYDAERELLAERRKVFESLLDEEDVTSESLLDHLFKAQKTNPDINDHMIQRLLLDILTAGANTTGTTLLWCVLYLAGNKSLQDLLYDEVKHNDISYRNKGNTPLVCSFIDEVLRHRCVTTLLVPHTVTESFEHEGKVFKKGDRLLPNAWAAHHDPKIFEEPYLFKPDRFIIDGQFVKSNFVIPFSIGPRMCFGKRLAEMDLYIVLCNIIRNFKLSSKEKLPSFEKGVFGILLNPLPFKINLQER